MQGQKQEFTRKQRKLFSRDRSGLIRNPNRVRSKEPEEKYINDQNSPKPKHLIIGLRNQLTNLRQEVAKLSRRDNYKGQQDLEVRLEYQGYSPRQKKISNSRFLEESKSQQHNHSNRNSRNKSREEVTIVKNEERQASVDRNFVNSQFQDLQKKNRQLQLENTQLRNSIAKISDQLRRNYEDKLNLERQRQRNQLYTQMESDRTVIIQKQNQEQQEIIQQLRDNINQINQSNIQLKKQVEYLRHHLDKVTRMEQQALQKEKKLQQLQFELKQSYKQLAKLRQQLVRVESHQNQLIDQERLANQNIQHLNSLLKCCQEEKEKVIAEGLLMKGKCFQLQRDNTSLKKRLESLEKKQAVSYVDKQKLKLQQLEDVIAMQEKSIQNYESDLNYLEEQLAKLAYLKPQVQKLNLINDELNEECIRLRLQRLNYKYTRL